MDKIIYKFCSLFEKIKFIVFLFLTDKHQKKNEGEQLKRKEQKEKQMRYMNNK